MARSGLAWLPVGLVGFVLSGCMQATLEPASETNFTQRDKKLLADAPYAKASIPQSYQRHIVDFHRKEAPGSIVVDTDCSSNPGVSAPFAVMPRPKLTARNLGWTSR